MVSRLVTPPPHVRISTPPTPKHGAGDDWDPYATSKTGRYPSRRSQKAQLNAQTPSPQSPYNLRGGSASPNDMASSDHPRSQTLHVSKRRGPRSSLGGDTRQVSGVLNEEGAALAAASLGLPSAGHTSKSTTKPATTTVRRNGMLPTPSKTPKKVKNPVIPGLNSIARNLFPVRYDNPDDAMPSPKKARKNKTGYTLDTLDNEEEDAPIAIYTDSHDRVPEVDLSSDNPFYGAQPAPEPTKRSSDKARKIEIPGEGEVTLEEAMGRDDGAVYVFRGKKKFMKFAQMQDDNDNIGSIISDDLNAALDATVPESLRGPLTRSSVKPRLLFSTAEQAAAKDKKPHASDDEEAMTDVEFSGPADEPHEEVATPVAPKFRPATPPSTIQRATRSVGFDGACDDDSDHAVTPSRGRKRGGDALTRNDRGIAKKPRATRSHAAY